MRPSSHCANQGLWELGAALAVFCFSLALFFKPHTDAITTPPRTPHRTFTYRGNDFPTDFTEVLGHDLPLVQIMEEDSRHYMFGLDNITQAEWRSTFPAGDGVVRVGPERRPFMLSMYNQLHCLNIVRIAVSAREGPTQASADCLRYMRQTILCSADTTLETTKPPKGIRAGYLRQCRDFQLVRVEAAHNYVQSLS